MKSSLWEGWYNPDSVVLSPFFVNGIAMVAMPHIPLNSIEV